MSDEVLNFDDVPFDQLPLEEKEKRARLLVRQPLESKEGLRWWLQYYLNVDLADCTVSRFSTSNPLQMVWDIYSFCKDNPNDEPMSAFYIAGRSSQKTLSSAVLAVLLPLHFKRGLVHFGGTEDQANRAYSYFKKFVSRPYIRDYLPDAPKISKTVFKIGDEEVEVEILPITDASVQGPHQPAVSIDELASLAPNKMAAYPSIAGVPSYTQDGKPWVKWGISSRKGRYTIVETEYEDRHKTGVQFKFWTVLENTKQCPDEISGTEPLEMWVNVYENIALLKHEFEALDPLKQQEYEHVNARKNCYNCPLKAMCAGDAKKQTSTCRTLKPIRATITEFKQSSLEWFLSQKMSIQPSAEDLIYPKFDREKFEKTPREMYAIFKGEDPGMDITEQILVETMIKAGVRRYAGLDHGYTHPTAIVIIYEDSTGNAYIMATKEQSGLEPGEVVEMIQKLHDKYKFNMLYPDTEAPAMNKMISNKKFVKVQDDFKKDVDAGIQLIRHRISPPAGGTKLFGLKNNCKSLIDNFEKYHFAYNTAGKLTDDPVKEFDDSHDALSYAAQNMWHKGKGIVTDKSQPQTEVPKEDQATYAGKVQKQTDNWMTQQINEAKKDVSGTEANVKSSKGGGFFWDI